MINEVFGGNEHAIQIQRVPLGDSQIAVRHAGQAGLPDRGDSVPERGVRRRCEVTDKRHRLIRRLALDDVGGGFPFPAQVQATCLRSVYST